MTSPRRRRLSEQQIELAMRAIPEDPTAEVIAVQPGAAKDGLALVTVDYLGAELALRYDVAYTPAIGHVVVLGRNAGDLYIKCRLGGYPPNAGSS